MKTNEPTYEIRLNDDESLDEVVAHDPTLVHIEQMSHKHWWMRIYMPDETVIEVNFWRKGRKVKARAEVNP